MACVLAASSSCRVAKFVYASSIQVVSSEPGTEKEPARVAYLPLDGESPPNPTNAYGLSKLGGEILLRTLFRNAGHEAVALRFPWLVRAQPDRAWGRRLAPLDQREPRVVVEQGLSCLSLNDAARLIHAVLRAHLPGFRTYLPAVSVVTRDHISRYIEQYYRGVPLRVPLGEMTNLVDLGRIKEETGWVPLDLPIHAPPRTAGSGSFARLVRRLIGDK